MTGVQTCALPILLNVIQKTKKYLSYVTTGQSVPDDIEIADQDKIAQLILRDGAR